MSHSFVVNLYQTYEKIIALPVTKVMGRQNLKSTAHKIEEVIVQTQPTLNVAETIVYKHDL